VARDTIFMPGPTLELSAILVQFVRKVSLGQQQCVAFNVRDQKPGLSEVQPLLEGDA